MFPGGASGLSNYFIYLVEKKKFFKVGATPQILAAGSITINYR